MSKIRVAINGFGRIGRVTSRILAQRATLDLVAVNDLTDTATLAHLLKYDSVHGVNGETIGHDAKHIIIGSNKVQVFAEQDPAKLPWKELGIDVVIESTGHFLTRELASAHLKAGARKVLLSAPAKDKTTKTVVLGVNDEVLDSPDDIISNASCTTNCAAPMIVGLDEVCGIEDGFISTVHSYTSDQRLHDAPHRDLRRARAAAVSIIPTTTGAAKAVTRVLPKFEGKLGGTGIRVPVPDGSITDIACRVKNLKTEKEINAHFKELAEGRMKGILRYTEDPIVGIDIVGDPASCIFDAKLTSVVGNMVKIMGWYDNEYGYSARLVDLVARLGKQ